MTIFKSSTHHRHLKTRHQLFAANKSQRICQQAVKS